MAFLLCDWCGFTPDIYRLLCRCFMFLAYFCLTLTISFIDLFTKSVGNRGTAVKSPCLRHSRFVIQEPARWASISMKFICAVLSAKLMSFNMESMKIPICDDFTRIMNSSGLHG